MNPGDKLGPYEILALIGEGGMGQVYRARDTRLNREVAIKVSAAQFSDRFSREASVVASLNHPNICTLHDVGPNFLVMELVEGPSLQDRMAQGPMSLDDTVSVAMQIAEALEAAHDKSIIHRDLKPANIKFTSEGKVKVLDFGLAKALDEDTSHASLANSPTLAPTRVAATQAGYILGTAGYMAPEQARGHAADRRADIWSFGVVLWEMVTGRRMFDGETVGDTLALVLTQSPEIDAAPPQLRALLRRCLERDRKKRLQAIGEARIALENPQPTQPAEQTKPTKASRLPWAIAACLAAISLITLGTLWMKTRPTPQPLTSFDVDLGVELPATYMAGSGIILSPDGRRMVYMDAGRRLWTRRLDQDKGTLLNGTEDSQGPFFSPDGRWIGFFSAGKLRKILVEGGSPISLCDAVPGSTRGGTWGENGTIIAALGDTRALSRIAASGGTPEPITKLDAVKKEQTHRFPHFLPGGKALLFVASEGSNQFDEATIEVQTLADGARKTLVQGGTFPRYHASGYLLYTNKQTLFAAPFDVNRLQLTGTATPVLDGVHYTPNIGYSQFDISRDGTLAYRKGVGSDGRTFEWFDASGRSTPLLPKPARYGSFRFSPDGTRLALSLEGAIWIYELARETMTRVTFTGSADSPVWTPDGKYIVFRHQGIWSIRADGGSKEQPLLQLAASMPMSFTPDGKTLSYTVQPNLWGVPIEEVSGRLRAGTPRQLANAPGISSAMFSPDGKWVAYSSFETGRAEVFVRASNGEGAKWQVSNAGGVGPRWSPDGRELYWRGEDQRIIAASYSRQGETIQMSKPRFWSEQRLPGSLASVALLDLHPDGKRFAVVQPPDQSKPPTTVTFLLHFAEELQRKLASQ
jgi:serine/threonine protein kinase/Tol biopolymer transport system component